MATTESRTNWWCELWEKWSIKSCCGNRKKLQNNCWHTPRAQPNQQQTNKQYNKQANKTNMELHKSCIIKCWGRHLHGGVHVRALVVTVASTVFRGSVLEREGKTINISPQLKHSLICPEDQATDPTLLPLTNHMLSKELAWNCLKYENIPQCQYDAKRTGLS